MMIWKSVIRISAAFLGMLALILDHCTAIEGAQAGISLCIQSVIPALLPFIFLSHALIPSKDVINNRFRYASIFLAGYLGGYPTGAQCAAQAFRHEQITQHEAKKLTICCNNPGPAFIFGIVSQFFSEQWVPLSLWLIHIFSSILLLTVIPADRQQKTHIYFKVSPSKPSLIRSTISTIGIICGWVILFRTFLHIAERWYLWFIPKNWMVFITGFLEITNGCMDLKLIDCTGLRYMLCAFFLSFGGLCTAMQTYSLSKEINCHSYIPLKLFEATVSLMIAYYLQKRVFPIQQQFTIQPFVHAVIILFLSASTYILIKNKKMCGISIPSVV